MHSKWQKQTTGQPWNQLLHLCSHGKITWQRQFTEIRINLGLLFQLVCNCTGVMASESQRRKLSDDILIHRIEAEKKPVFCETTARKPSPVCLSSHKDLVYEGSLTSTEHQLGTNSSNDWNLWQKFLAPSASSVTVESWQTITNSSIDKVEIQ